MLLASPQGCCHAEETSPPPPPSKAYPAPNVSTAEVGKACGVRCRHHVGGNVTGLDVARLSVSLLQAALLF